MRRMKSSPGEGWEQTAALQSFPTPGQRNANLDQHPPRRDERRPAWQPISLCALATAILAIETYEFLLGPTIANSPGIFSDLKIYRDAVDSWWHGGALYSYRSDNPSTSGLGFTYPPFAALAFLPMLAIPLRVLEWMWTLGSIAVILSLSAILTRASARVPEQGETAREHIADQAARTSLVIIMLGLSYPVVFNLMLGQVSLIVIYLAFVDAAAVAPRRLRGVLIGFAAGLKLTPLVFIPFLLLTRQSRAALVACTTFLSTVAVAFIVSPNSSMSYWTRDAWQTSRMGETWLPWNKSILALISRWHTGGAGRTQLWLSLCLLVATYAFTHAWRSHAQGNDVAAALVIGSSSVVLSPISWTHHQIWAVLVAAALALGQGRRTAWMGAALFAVFFFGFPLSGYTKWLDTPMPLAWRIPMEVPVVAFVCIVVFDLPGMVLLRPRPSEVGGVSGWHHAAAQEPEGESPAVGALRSEDAG